MRNIDKIKSMTVEEMAEYLLENEQEAIDGCLWNSVDNIVFYLKKETIVIHKCDICKKQSDVKEISCPVMFTTDQTEGRPVKPYISQQKIELCEECLNKAITIWGNGAQGYNNYEIRR